MYRIIMLLLIICLTTTAGRAQFVEGGYHQKKFGYAEGYTGARCVNTYFDHTGRFWFVNNLGVSSFDGTEFTNYTIKDGLNNENPSFFSEDINGVLYISDDHTICAWMPGRKPQFRTFYRLPRASILGDITVVDSNDFYYTGDDYKTIGHVFHKKDAPVAGITEQIIRLTHNGNVVYGISEEGNVFVIRNGRQIAKYPVPIGQLSISLALPPFVTDKKGYSWFIGPKLYRLSPSGITDSLPMPENAATEYYRVAFDSKDRCFYAMARNWLYYYNGSTMNMVPGQLSVTDSALAVASSMSRGLYTNGRGVVYKIEDKFGLAQLTKLNYATPQTTLWFASSDGHNGRVFSYDTSLRRHPYMQQYIMPAIGNRIISAYDDRQGNTLYCLLDGLAIQKKGEKTCSYLYRGDSSQSSVVGDQAIGIVMEDREGNLWAKGETRIVRLSGNSRKVYETEASHFKLCLDKNDHLWTAGTFHLYVCDEDTIHDVTAKMPVRLKSITSLANDRNGDVWISGSNYTIYKLTTAGKDRYLCTDSVVLDQRNKTVDVQSIQFDSRGNLWAAFPDYLYVFFADGKGSYDKEHYLCLTEEDGIGKLFEGNLINMQRTVEGNMLLIEPPMPVLRVDEILERYRREAPQVYFTGLQLFGHDQNWAADGFRLRADGLPDDLRLPYDQNTLTFRFSSIVFHNASYCHYEYRLEGMGNNWQEADVARKVTYNNLPPGHYTFQVRAANENGFMSAPLSYSFTIAPPWYKSWWAITLWIVLSCGLLLVAFYLRQRAIVRKYQAEQMITEQKLIALRAQINPHFLQNTFAFLAQHVLYETKESTVNAIKKVSAYLRGVLRGSDSSVVTLEEELEFTEEYLRLQQMLLHDRFVYAVDIADDVDTLGIQVPSMLFQPLVENAVKYGAMHKDACTITLQVTRELPYTVCTISNTGSREQGAAKEAGHISKGMQLTRNKLELVFARSKHKPVFTAGYTGTDVYTVVIKIPLA
ncbi:sensor histidine kinase [Taibaiella koreensis]|uniref:sensor histidine kinase n=1 Tax=Taibaiella koreensis TaxID=1268548 RepID=UPI0013C2F79A|nr:sensor histidine kinase [Taibaiella koreensis]